MNNLILAGLIAASLVSAAQGSLLTQTLLGPAHRSNPTHRGDGGGIAGTTNTVVPISLAGANSWDLVGDVSNQVILVDLAAALGLAPGTSITMTSIGWATNQQAVGASFLSQMRLYFDDNVAPDLVGLFLSPGSAVANNNGNLPMAFTSGVGPAGQIDLTANAIPNIVLPNGILRIELNESLDDVADAIDGTFLAGSVVTVGVLETAIPGPGALALLGLAGLIGRSRRRA